MNSIIDIHLDFYVSLSSNKKRVLDLLSVEGISVLKGFVENIDTVKRFYNTVYKQQSPRIVLCGINPGRLGAGKTGVPFLDYESLAKMKIQTNNTDSELSSKFIYSVIENIGIERFFDNVYLSNISWFGFVKGNKNYNYYELSDELQMEFTNSFIEEMEIVRPIAIIPLSKEVKKSLIRLKKQKLIDVEITETLAHPYYYSNFPSRYDEGLRKYTEAIENYIA